MLTGFSEFETPLGNIPIDTERKLQFTLSASTLLTC